MSREKQDDWKRTQIRIPVGIYDDIADYAEKNNLSLNTAMLELMDRGLKSSTPTTSQEEINDAIKAFLEQYMPARRKQ